MSQEQAKFGDHGRGMIRATEPTTRPTNLMEMAAFALERGDGLEVIEKIMDLQDRHEAKEAKKAYVRAMAEFKKVPLKILKDAHVKYKTTKGVTEYKHATLGAVVDAVVVEMGKHGLSHSWTPAQGKDFVTVSCTITHEAGHSETVSLSGPVDSSGGKNAIQAIGSSVSYLERYTLLALTGMATHEQDDDAVSEPPKPINANQVATIIALIKTKKVDETIFLDYMGAKSIHDIQATDFKRAMMALNKAKGEPNA